MPGGFVVPFLFRLRPQDASSLPLLYVHWCNILHSLGESSRQNLLAGLSLLVPAIDRLGDKYAAMEICDALDLVSAWRP